MKHVQLSLLLFAFLFTGLVNAQTKNSSYDQIFRG